MSIDQLRISHFRNIASAQLDLSDRLNLVSGPNASGKSSLIEAVYVLSRARSFRSARLNRVIQNQHQAATVFCRLSAEAAHDRVALTIEKGRTVAKLDGTTVPRLSDLAKAFPVQLLTPRSYRLLSSGPKNRRRLIHWGLFHVEPRFLSVYKRYMTTLAQRNAALKRRIARKEFPVWDHLLSELAAQIRQFSQVYFSGLEPCLSSTTKALLPGHEIQLEFLPGWEADRPLADVLREELDKDLERGYTRKGSHRADIKIRLDGQAIDDYGSNGQQKLFVFAFMKAQADYYASRLQCSPLMLLDDFASELDHTNQARLIRLLNQPGVQSISTSLEPDVPHAMLSEARMFHVERGVFHVEHSG